MPHPTTSRVTLIITLVVTIAGSAEAVDPLYALAEKIGPSGTLVSDGFFGSSVAVDGSLAVVGSPGCKAASVLVKTPDGWLIEAEILAPLYSGDPFDILYVDFGQVVERAQAEDFQELPRGRIHIWPPDNFRPA